MAYWFLPHIVMNQPQVHVCPLPLGPPLPPPTPSTPLGCHRALGLSSLGHRATSHQRSILHLVMEMFLFFKLNLFILIRGKLLYNIVLVLPYINMNPPRCTRVPNPEPPSHLHPHTILLGHSIAPAPSTLYHASNLDWRFVSHMILYMFQCHSPKSYPLPFPQSPKDCSIHLSLFCCLAYRVIITIFLNPIYMHQYTVLVFFFLAYFTLYNRLQFHPHQN